MSEVSASYRGRWINIHSYALCTPADEHTKHKGTRKHPRPFIYQDYTNASCTLSSCSSSTQVIRWVVVRFCFSLRFKYSIITDNQMLMIHSHYNTASAQPLFGFMTNDAFRVSVYLFTTTNVCSSDFFVILSKRVHNGES